MKIILRLMVYNVFLLNAQTKLDSLDSLIKYNETLVINTVLRIDSLQNLIEDLQESYAHEQFLLLERDAVVRINRAAFAGMWTNKPLMGKRIDIPQGVEIIFYPYYIQDFIRISLNDTIGYMSSAFYDQVGLPPYFQEARERAFIREKNNLNLENESDRFKRREKERIHEEKYLAKRIEDLTFAQKKEEYRKRILLDKWGDILGHKINDGVIEIGFTEVMVEEAIGRPDRVNRTIYSYYVREQWVYNEGDYRYIYLEDGIVTAIQNKG